MAFLSTRKYQATLTYQSICLNPLNRVNGILMAEADAKAEADAEASSQSPQSGQWHSYNI